MMTVSFLIQIIRLSGGGRKGLQVDLKWFEREREEVTGFGFYSWVGSERVSPLMGPWLA